MVDVRERLVWTFPELDTYVLVLKSVSSMCYALDRCYIKAIKNILGFKPRGRTICISYMFSIPIINLGKIIYVRCGIANIVKIRDIALIVDMWLDLPKNVHIRRKDLAVRLFTNVVENLKSEGVKHIFFDFYDRTYMRHLKLYIVKKVKFNYVDRKSKIAYLKL